MNSKALWFWLGVAGILAAVIVGRQYIEPEPILGPMRVLPELKRAQVQRLQIQPRNQLEIRVERTNDAWVLTAPLPSPYLAQSLSVEQLLSALEKLTPATSITPSELKDRPNADEDYGFKHPQATIIVQQGDYRAQILLGTLTAPGDQLFLQVVGAQPIHVVDSSLLKLVPKTANEWRDRRVLQLESLRFDRLSVTNGPRFFELVKPGSAAAWRMVSPIEARAASQRVQETLQRLGAAAVDQFVSDGPQADLESFGLQPAELQVAFKRDTNTLAILQFGKSPTNNPTLVYARLPDANSIVTVPRDLIEGWRGSVNDFRDPHLVGSLEAVETVAVECGDSFALRRGTNDSWRMLPQDWPADPELVTDFLRTLAGIHIVEFTKDIVTPVELPNFGLATPRCKYVFSLGAVAGTNQMAASLDFGTNQNEKVFVRRADESSVYAISAKDFARLPSAAIQLRDRMLWNFSEDELAGVTIRQQGRVRHLLRKGPHQWALAPGSQGIINELAIEETVRPLCHLAAWAWVARGEPSRGHYGLADNGHEITLEFRNGEKRTIEFGHPTASDSAYAGVNLSGEVWIFEFPPSLYRFVANYLTIPVG